MRCKRIGYAFAGSNPAPAMTTRGRLREPAAVVRERPLDGRRRGGRSGGRRRVERGFLAHRAEAAEGDHGGGDEAEPGADLDVDQRVGARLVDEPVEDGQDRQRAEAGGGGGGRGGPLGPRGARGGPRGRGE